MSAEVETVLKRVGVTISKPTLAVVTIIFGILILAFESVLRWLVGIYLIIQGILLFLDYYEIRIRSKTKIQIKK